MTKKQLFYPVMVAVLAMFLTSCSQIFYQVYEVKSNALKMADNSLVYENSDLKVMYNLWSKGGEVNFVIYNKTDRDIFVDLGQSFFIFNGEATDYLQNREFTKSSAVATTIGYEYSMFAYSTDFWPNTYMVPNVQNIVAKALKGNTKSVTTKEKEIVCVPANSFKKIHGETILQPLLMTCDKNNDYPKTKAVAATYTESSSPSRLRNRISYSFDKNGSDLRQIENDFYLSSITNYSKKAATEQVMESVGCSKTFKKKTYYFKIGGPDKFYKSYKR